jgi:hypothetical protein
MPFLAISLVSAGAIGYEILLMRLYAIGQCLANSYYLCKSPLFHGLVNPGGNGTIGVHA